MEAFLYCWVNTQNNKLYIGSHVGCDNDGYVCSSKVMLKEYRNNPSIFKRSIIAHGTESDIRQLETVLLKRLDAANSDEFYNLINHAYPQKTGWHHSLEARAKISAAGIGNKHSAGPSKLKKIANSKKLHIHTEEHKARMRSWRAGNKSNTGRIWINNGNESIMFNKNQQIPEGYSVGRGNKNIWSK